MADKITFESYERRIDKINKALNVYVIHYSVDFISVAIYIF